MKTKTTNFTLKNFQPISFANAVVSMIAESLVVDAPDTAPGDNSLKLENGSIILLTMKDILRTLSSLRLQMTTISLRWQICFSLCTG